MRPYHFALLRFVPSAAAEEFVNVGVVLWSVDDRILHFRMSERSSRLSAFFREFDRGAYRQMALAMAARLNALRGTERAPRMMMSHPESLQEVMDRAAPRDESGFQWSEIGGGVAVDPERRVQQLYAELVERHEATGPRERRDEVAIWASVEDKLIRHDLIGSGAVARGVEFVAPNYSYRFKAAWKNGVAQFLEPISLDYLDAAGVIEKANTWSGRLFNLSAGDSPFQFTGVVSTPARTDLREPFDRAVKILREAPSVRRILHETELDEFIPEILHDIQTDQ